MATESHSTHGRTRPRHTPRQRQHVSGADKRGPSQRLRGLLARLVSCGARAKAGGSSALVVRRDEHAISFLASSAADACRQRGGWAGRRLQRGDCAAVDLLGSLVSTPSLMPGAPDVPAVPHTSPDSTRCKQRRRDLSRRGGTASRDVQRAARELRGARSSDN